MGDEPPMTPDEANLAPSALEQRLAQRLGPGMALPVPLCRAWSFMESQGWGGTDADGDPILTPYPGTAQLGAVFSASLSTRGWLDPDAPGAKRLVPIAETDGSGGFAAIWFDDAGAPRFLWFSSEGGRPQRLADDPIDFLRLIAVGYSEFTDWVWGAPPVSFADTHPEEAEEGAAFLMNVPVTAHGQFRTWVEDTFDVVVPEVWTVTDDAEFDAWLHPIVAAHGIGDGAVPLGQEPAPAPSPQADLPEVHLEGDLAGFLLLLGEEDDHEAVEMVSSLLGITIGETLRASGDDLEEVGVEVRSSSEGVQTIWLSMREYPRPAQLVDGLTEKPTRDDVLAFLGEPERAGTQWLRYDAPMGCQAVLSHWR